MAARTGTRERYADELGVLWSGLNRTLRRLDAIAGEPERLEDEATVATLRRLQYALHLANEHAYGLAPPPGAETAHAELAAALAAARDATAEISEAVSEEGLGGAAPLLHEWRGALFRVRLARLRVATPKMPQTEAGDAERPGIAAPLVAFALATCGAVGFVAGATLGLWPVWVAGLVAVCASIVCYRP